MNYKIRSDYGLDSIAWTKVDLCGPDGKPVLSFLDDHHRNFSPNSGVPKTTVGQLRALGIEMGDYLEDADTLTADEALSLLPADVAAEIEDALEKAMNSLLERCLEAMAPRGVTAEELPRIEVEVSQNVAPSGRVTVQYVRLLDEEGQPLWVPYADLYRYFTDLVECPEATAVGTVNRPHIMWGTPEEVQKFLFRMLEQRFNNRARSEVAYPSIDN